MKVNKKLSALLFLILLGCANVTKAQTTLYVDGTTSGNTHFASLYAALNYASGKNATLGAVTIEVRVNSNETNAITLKTNDNITIVNRTSSAHSINYTTRPATSMIVVSRGSVLTLGSETNGSTAPLIFRACASSSASSMEAGGKTLFKVIQGGILNIYDNTEIGFGDVPVWIASINNGRPVVNMYGGVIHSAKIACVEVQNGTFNMYGGYIVGHYKSSGNVLPNLEQNRILDYDYVDNHFKNRYGVEEPIVREQDVTRFLKSYYNQSLLADLNNGFAVYLHRNTNPANALFNMYGGTICGFCPKGARDIPIGNNGTGYSYYATKKQGPGIYVNRATVNIYDGKIYAMQSPSAGGAIMLTNDDFNSSAVNIQYNEGSVTMTGGCVHYSESSNNGGGIRVENGTTFTMSGGSVCHNVTYNDANSGGSVSGGGGGFRIVAAKLNVSGDADISYNHSTGTTEKFTGAGIAGVWQASYGQAKTIINLNGGRIHHNVAEHNGGGVVGTDKGNSGAIGIDIAFNGVEIDHNVSKASGGGVYVGGSADIIIDENTETGMQTRIHHNEAKSHGGGIHVSSANTGGHIGGVEASKCQIYDNVVTSSGGNGGGLYSEYAYVILHDGADIYNHAITGKGAGVCIAAKANYTQDGGTIRDNSAQDHGGGFYITGGGNVTITGGSIDNNTTGNYGGGFYVNGGKLSVSNALVTNNKALSGFGGGFYSNVGVTVDNAHIGHNKAVAGGGFYVPTGTTIIRNGSVLDQNEADNGGGLYLANGTVTFTDATLQGNRATNGQGGGLYLGSGTITVSGSSSSISSNYASSRGAGVYVGSGRFNMTGGTIGGSVDQGNFTGSGGFGGGLYMNGGTATLTGGTVSANSAPLGNGGGIYMDGGVCTLSGGSLVGGLGAGNTARYGGGIYSANGSITVNGGHIDYNTATDGGGIYSNGPDATVTIIKEGTTPSLLEYNQAVRGGGIFANRGVVDFTDGQVRHNTASEAGGGMYVNTEGTLNLKGSATLSGNHVPATGKGGGVYLDGTLNVGENAADPIDRHSLKVDDNYAGTPSTPNNVYLHDMDDVVTLLSDISGKDSGGNYHSHIGFSVDMGFRPVIYAATAHVAWLTSLMGTGSALAGAIFDDSQKYIAIHVNEDSAPFENEYIYLWACWTTAVTSDPGTAAIKLVGDTYHIKSKEGLAWFVSLVNGLNHREDDEGHTEAGSNPFTEAKPTLKGILEADVDMHEFLWVPIGGVGSYNAFDPSSMSSIFTAGGSYEGTFDGRGHTISGLDCRYITAIDSYGLFGNLKEAASVSNTFVKDYYFEAQDNSITYNIGGIAGTMGDDASIANCEAKGTVTVTRCGTASTVGGLVGKMDGTSEIHSSIGIPDVAADAAARHIGGIAGEVLASGNAIRNSFANASFGATADTVGGLVGKNSGLVENCYARLRGAAPGNFGYLVGDNTNGTVKYSYATLTDYTISGKEGTLEGHGTYGITQLPYLYKHRDTQVEATNPHVPTDASADKQLMIVLNKWVEAPAQASGNYTKWGRPWQESDAQKPLNDDYPILRMPMANAVASSQGDPYLDYNDIDMLLASRQAADEAIWMYNNSESVTGDNSGSAAKLYIAEDVVLLNDNPLKAYVGITLDNSAGTNGAHPTYGSFVGITTDATDWHMISTPLSDAPLGIEYTDNTAWGFDLNYGHPSGMPYYRFYPESDTLHGYFPSHRYNKDYPTSNTSIEDGSYYQEWDFYSYDEPQYHWINFKRNSASHYHFDTENHDPLTYKNEKYLVPGKGYFAATREETFLQCQGHLNAADVIYDLTQTAGVPRHGYNLIGNPYQAYLDFDAFAEANSNDVDAIWSDANEASYTILDEDYLELGGTVETLYGAKPVFYKTFSYGCSSNPDVSAGGFIHPHQGFFVRLGEDKTEATAYFFPDQRNATDTVGSKFRGAEHVDYPLVNLFAIEESGAADVVTVELGRPDQGGAPLMQGLRVGNGKIWCHYNDKDYAIAYTQPGITEAAIRFESVTDTEYTMRWSTRNGEFSYLHLIGNLTGADVDCLTTDEYRFSSKTTDYKSRFRLVFGYTGIEEDAEAETNENFAFVMGDELVVTGEGVLQVFDMTGRMVASQELHGVQTRVSLPKAANGVYVLRLTEGKQSRIQKMVISK